MRGNSATPGIVHQRLISGPTFGYYGAQIGSRDSEEVANGRNDSNNGRREGNIMGNTNTFIQRMGEKNITIIGDDKGNLVNLFLY